MHRGAVLAALLALAGAPARAGDDGPASNRRDEVHCTPVQARARVFGPAFEWRDTVLEVDSAARARLFAETGLVETERAVVLGYARRSDGSLLGVYRVASEVGKYLPFEFFVALDSALCVRDIVVLTYREARGGEVRRERFVRQYRNRSAEHPLSLNRDIVGISGATLSVQAVNRGVKKTLFWANRAFAGD